MTRSLFSPGTPDMVQELMCGNRLLRVTDLADGGVVAGGGRFGHEITPLGMLRAGLGGHGVAAMGRCRGWFR